MSNNFEAQEVAIEYFKRITEHVSASLISSNSTKTRPSSGRPRLAKKALISHKNPILEVYINEHDHPSASSGGELLDHQFSALNLEVVDVEKFRCTTHIH